MRKLFVFVIVFVLWHNSETVRFDSLGYSMCDSKIPGTNLLLCHCDAQCTYYKDCCHGYAQNDSQTNEAADVGNVSEMSNSTCIGFPGDYKMYYMYKTSFSRVPAGLTRMVNPCRNPNRTDPQEALPIYNFKLQENFRNYFCLVLKDRRIYKNNDSISTWTITLASRCFQKYLEEFSHTQHSRNYMQLLSDILSLRHCIITFVPPGNSTTRTCFQHKTEKCKNDAACQSYQSPAVGETETIYKNAHCAACSGSHVTSRLGDGEPLDDRKTLLTLYRIDAREVSRFIDATRYSCQGCNFTCPSDQIKHLNRCIEPVAKVRGYLYQVEVKTKASHYLHIDDDKVNQFVSRIIGPMNNIYVKSRVNSIKMAEKGSGCQHVIQISFYLRNDVTFEYYLNMSKYVKFIFENRKGLKEDIINMTRSTNKSCPSVGTTFGDYAGLEDSSFEMVSVAIFSSVLGAFILGVVVVTLVKVIMAKLARNRDSGDNDSPAS